MLGLFLPVFLLIQYGYKIEKVIYFFLIGYLVYAFLVPWGAMAMSKLNLKRSLIVSMPFLAAHYLCLYYFDLNVSLFTALALVFLIGYRFFYWIPYHTDFAKFTDRKNRGKQISYLTSLASLVSIAVPFTGGFILDQFDFKVLFIIVLFLTLAAAIPFFLIKPVDEKFSFGYWETYRRLFQKENRRMLLAYGADGAENSVGVVMWPIFMWQILNGEYLAVGAISSLVVLVTIILRLVMGKYTDKMKKRKLIRTGTILYSLGWIAKTFVVTGFQIFIASTYHNFATVVMRTPFDTLMYEKAADSGHYVDEYSVLREIALNFGRALMFIFILIIIGFGGINLAFPLAAIMSLFINAL